MGNGKGGSESHHLHGAAPQIPQLAAIDSPQNVVWYPNARQAVHAGSF